MHVNLSLSGSSGNTYKIIDRLTEEDRHNANVYICTDQTGKKYALKHFYNGTPKANLGINVYNHYGRRRDGSELVFDEIRNKANDHDFLVKHIDRINYNGTWLIVMEFVEGELLRTYLNKKKKFPEELSEAVGALGKELSKWHSNGFAHGDGHLENAIINKTEDGITIKLIDYGLIHHPDFHYCKHIGCFEHYDRFSEDWKMIRINWRTVF